MSEVLPSDYSLLSQTCFANKVLNRLPKFPIALFARSSLPGGGWTPGRVIAKIQINIIDHPSLATEP